MKESAARRIDVLLATYNGEKYVEQQLDSILSQTHPHLHIFIRDDGSKDNTRHILQQWQQKSNGQITLLPEHNNLGVIGNFSALMQHSTAPYVMFSDQDDIWLPNKVAITLEKMQQLEHSCGEAMPILVHTDLKVVDAALNEIDSSFWNYARLSPQKSHSFNRLLAQNVITGCTIMMNRSLANLSSPFPKQAMMHDWWIGLTAAAFGKIDVVTQPTMLYRQHGGNQLGAQKGTFWAAVKRVWNEPEKHMEHIVNLFGRQQQQAALFREAFNNKLTPSQIQILLAFSELRYDSFFRKGYLIFRHGFYKNGFWRNLRSLLPTYYLIKLIKK